MRDTRRHGFIETVSNGRVTKTLWLNGHEMVKYRFPKIQARFSSPLVSEDNLHLCGARSWTPYAGGPWLDIDQTIVDRVLSGLKPVGFAGLTSAAWLQLVERRARASEVTTLTRPHAFPHVHCEIGLARPGTVGGTFDLEALEHDYRNYLASAPAEAVAEAVGLIHALESRPIAASTTASPGQKYLMEMSDTSASSGGWI